jgi:predicted peroxiredoxin
MNAMKLKPPEEKQAGTLVDRLNRSRTNVIETQEPHPGLKDIIKEGDTTVVCVTTCTKDVLKEELGVTEEELSGLNLVRIAREKRPTAIKFPELDVSPEGLSFLQQTISKVIESGKKGDKVIIYFGWDAVGQIFTSNRPEEVLSFFFALDNFVQNARSKGVEATLVIAVNPEGLEKKDYARLLSRTKDGTALRLQWMP